jgi:SprB repeat/HYR domain/Dockerin type I domain
MDEILHSLRHRKQLLFKSFCLILFLTFNVFKSEAHLPANTPASNVNKPQLALTLTTTVTPDAGACGGESFIDVMIQNGTGPYKIEVFLDGLIQNTINWFVPTTYSDYFTSAGTYDITVTDASGSVATSTFTLGLTLKLIETRDIKCKLGLIPKLDANLFKGGVEVMAMGGIGPYTFILDVGTSTTGLVSPTYTIESLEAGTHIIEVFDEGTGCSSASITFEIEDLSGDPLFATFTPKDIVCGGTATGEIAIATTGGKLPLIFILDNDTILPASNPTPPNFIYKDLSFDTHKVVVSDVNGCSITNADIFIDQLDPLSISVDVANVKCKNGETGALVASATGGTAPYKYLISGGNYSDPLAAGDPYTFSSLSAGTYTVTVIDANSCTATLSKTITEPSEITFSVKVINVNCNGEANGKLIIDAVGGTGALKFSRNDIDFYDLDPLAELYTFSGLTAGFYTVTVMDVNSCSTAVSVEVKEPEPLTVSVKPTDIQCLLGLVPRLSSSLFTGSIEVMAMGGTVTTGYTYEVYQGGFLYGTYTDPLIEGLSAGFYSVVVIDDNVCTATIDDIEIKAPTIGPLKTEDISVLGNILCKGDKTGGLSITTSGANLPLTFTFNDNNNPTTPTTSSDPTYTFTGLKGGSYNILVTDAKGCTFNDVGNIPEPPGIFMSIDVIDIQCKNGATGQLIINATGGTGELRYSIKPSIGDPTPFQTSNTFTGLIAEVYTVTVMDVNSCTASISEIFVSEPDVSVTIVPTNLRCNGIAEGQLEVNVVGANTPISYSLDGTNFVSSNTFTGLSAISYTVTVMYDNVCSITATQALTQPDPLSIGTVSTTPATCATGGTVTITNTTGGTVASNYTYKLTSSLSNTTGNFTNVSSGNYTLTVTDDNGCEATTPVSVLSSLPPSITVNLPTSVLCNGGNSGSFTFSVSNGSTPYTVVVKNALNTVVTTSGSNPYTASNLVAGMYSISVTDNASCTALQSVTITQPDPLSITSIAPMNIKCKGDATGQLVVTATGGTGTIEYSKDGIAYQPSNTFTGLINGTYTITVRDANSCTAVLMQTITEPTNALSITSIAPMNVKCKGNATGELVVTATGGTGTIEYSKDGTTYQPSNTFLGLINGTYTITVRDANSCTAVLMQTITEPTNALSITSIAPMNVKCKGDATGELVVTATGGTGTIEYSKNGTTYQASNTFTGLIAGIYTITVRDANSCTAVLNQTITEPMNPLSITSIVPTNVKCRGDATGQLVVTATGGTGTIEYSKDGTTYQPSNTFTGLIAGTYTITVRDANSCTATLMQTITEPTNPLSITSIAPTNVKCKGDATGQLVVTATGGTGTIEYSKDGTTYQPSNTFTGLIAGTYTITVRDANSCTAVLIQTITEPTTPLSITSIVPTNVKCKGDATGELVVTATGGTGTIEYSKNGTTYQASNTFTGLIAGIYTITVRDANSCTATLMQTITEPTNPLSITSIVPTNVKCRGDATGQLVVKATGGTGTIEYSKDGTTYQSSNTFTGLIAGTYTITVRDANSCTATLMQTIAEPTKALSLALVSSTDIKCKGDLTGKIEVMAMGGTPDYTYEVNGTSFTTNIYESLSAGNYKIKVIDENGCMDMLNVTLNEPLAPLSIVSIPTIDVKCKGDATGKITVNPTGGTIAYSYSINGINFQPSNVFDNLFAKTYTVTVKDANGCIVTQDVEIKEPDLKLSLALTNKIDLDCIIRSSSATVSATGGTGAYTYKLGSTTQTTATFTNLAVGDYVISVTDENSCVTTVPLSIVDNKVNPGAPNALSNITLCQSAQVVLSPTGSTGSYNFYDKNPTTNVGLIPLATYKTTYTFTPLVNTTIWITAVTGVCESTPIAVTVTILEPLKLTAIPTKPLCPNGMDGKIDLTITGGITPYIINWAGSNGFTSTNEDLTGLKAGTYNVEVKLNGFTCKETLQVIVPEGMDMTPPTIKTKDLTVYLDAQGTATVTAAQLDNGTTDNCLLQSIAIDKGNFTCGNVGINTVVFTATDAYGNSASSNVTVTVVDNIKPVIVCPAPIEVTLKALECSRKIDFAAATATDNCVSLVTQTGGNLSGSLFEAGSHKVVFRATDPSGNTSECVVDIKVNEYKAGGAILCAGEINLSLGDLCINQVKPSTILLGGDYRCLNSYTVMLKDKNGRLVADDYVRDFHIGTRMTISVVDPKTGSSCWGYANIEDKIAPVIQCPFDALVLCDDVEAGSSPLSSLTGEPRLIYECSRTNTRYFDEFIETNCSETFTTKPANFPADLSFSFDKGAQSSKIIIRTFTVTDIYNNSTKCKQAIYVKRATLDRVSCPASVTVTCVSGYQNLNPRDTTINGITYKGTGEPMYSNGNPLMTGSCKILAGYSDRIFTYVNSGNKEIERTWTILNCCTGEKTTCIQTLKIVDLKPTLALKTGQKFDLTTTKTVQVSDNQLINTVSDDCTAKADLQLGMRKKGNGSGFPTVRNLTFTCLDKGKFIVEIWVKDGLGNTEMKEVEIEITDVNNNCNPLTPRIALSGSVTRENGDKITSLVTLYKNNDSITTQQTADFNFIDLPTGANYRLKPVRDNDIFNGVTTFDISIISRYLIGIDSTNFNSPARMIAADVNADGEINGADMIHIRNLILRKASSFPNNKAWRFVSKNYVFLNPKSPFDEDFPEILSYNNLNQSITQANFTAIKVGDVNGTAISNFTGTNTTTLNNRGSKPVLSIETEDIELKKGETKTLSFRLNDPSVSGLTAVQFALNFDKTKANIANIKQGEIANWTEANQNLIASEGILATAWSSGKATRFDKNQSVFSLAITAKEDMKLSEITRQNAAFTEGIAYDAAGNELSIQLIFNKLGIKETSYEYSLLQNVPNPFTNETVIPFTMSKEDLATLTVFDATGKIVSTTQRTFTKGYNEVLFKTPNQSNAGVYYYRLQTGEFSAVKRMVLVK